MQQNQMRPSFNLSILCQIASKMPQQIDSMNDYLNNLRNIQPKISGQIKQNTQINQSNGSDPHQQNQNENSVSLQIQNEFEIFTNISPFESDCTTSTKNSIFNINMEMQDHMMSMDQMSNVAQPQEVLTHLVQDNCCKNCSNSYCIKRYCQCFKEQKYCTNCNHPECKNVKEFDELRQEKIKEILDKDPNAFVQKNIHRKNFIKRNKKSDKLILKCVCKNQKCEKQYCACLKKGVPCSKNCRCNHKKCKNKGHLEGNIQKRQRKGFHIFDDDDDDSDSDHSDFEI